MAIHLKLTLLKSRGVDQVSERRATAPKTDTSVSAFLRPSIASSRSSSGALELVLPTSWPSLGVRIAVAVLAVGAWVALDRGTGCETKITG